MAETGNTSWHNMSRILCYEGCSAELTDYESTSWGHKVSIARPETHRPTIFLAKAQGKPRMLLTSRSECLGEAECQGEWLL